MNTFTLYSLLFLFGGNAYCTIELIYRARTHYSMFFCAGLAVIIMYSIFQSNSGRSPLVFALLGAAVITCLEFIFGVAFNLILDMNVWDYSALPLNLFGQICLPFTAIWFAFSFVMYYLFKLLGRA